MKLGAMELGVTEMKLSTRPVSSPGRVDKFPPQLMRFLRTNASSRSTRGSRSRASPIFVIQRASVADTKEPSSPKVTCMGQVRVRRSKQGTRKKGSCCLGIFFCRSSKGGGVGVKFSFLRRSLSWMPSWTKWGSFFRFGRGNGSGGKLENFGHRPVEEDDDDDDDDDDENERKVNCFGPSPCSPPKNALILTRCRSAPYTSSSLAYRFWGSPLESERTVRRRSTDQLPKTEQVENENGGFAEEGDEWEETDREGNPNAGIKTDWELHNMNGTDSPVQHEDGALRSDDGKGLKTVDRESEVVRPLMLTRCKSEPASSTCGENMRVGIVDSCPGSAS